MPSKLGPHIQKVPTSFSKWVSAGTTAFKFAQGQGAANELPSGVLAVGRRNQNAPRDWKALKNEGKSPEAVARMRFEHNRHEYTHPNNQRIDVWEDDNEVVPDNEEEAKWYSEYSIHMMNFYNSIGKKRANFSFAVGTPEMNIWPHLLPAIRHAHANGHYIALHEYMAYEADLGVGWNQVKDGQKWRGYWHGRKDAAGNPIEDYPYGWGVLRYRMVWDEVLRPQGLQNTPLLITEAGCDIISFTPQGMNTGSWKSHRTRWADEGKNPEKHYAEMLQWYDSELRKDSFVKAAFIFTVGQVSPWVGFEVAETAVEDHLLDYIARERGQINRSANGAAVARPQPKARPQPIDPTPVGSLHMGVVNAANGLNLRTEPSTQKGKESIIRNLHWGSVVSILENTGEWLRVQAGENEGFVYASYITQGKETLEKIPQPALPNQQARRNTNRDHSYDLLSYLRGDGRAYMVKSQQSGNQELVFSLQENNRFYTCKGEYHYGNQGVVCNWEEMWTENGYIMRGIDTSPDENRYYTQSENGRHGSRWVKQQMKVGDSVQSNPYVQFFLKKDGSKHSGNSGQAHNTITLVAHHDSITFPGDMICEDVIELKWQEGKEVYYYMKNVGLVGWKGLHDGHTPTFNAVSEWLNGRSLPKRVVVNLEQLAFV